MLHAPRRVSGDIQDWALDSPIHIHLRLRIITRCFETSVHLPPSFLLLPRPFVARLQRMRRGRDPCRTSCIHGPVFLSSFLPAPLHPTYPGRRKVCACNIPSFRIRFPTFPPGSYFLAFFFIRLWSFREFRDAHGDVSEGYTPNRSGILSFFHF